MQLINFIRRLLKNEFTLDKSYHYRDIKIHPIIVVHDHQYNVPGFNSLINYWFQAELEQLKEEKLYIEKIRPLTIINIDSLIYHQVALSKNVPLQQVLEKYYEHTRVHTHLTFRSEEDGKKYVLAKQVAFSTFINEYFHNLKLREIPPILETVAPLLFNTKAA
jgi:hypothetical protein